MVLNRKQYDEIRRMSKLDAVVKLLSIYNNKVPIGRDMQYIVYKLSEAERYLPESFVSQIYKEGIQDYYFSVVKFKCERLTIDDLPISHGSLSDQRCFKKSLLEVVKEDIREINIYDRLMLSAEVIG